MISSSEMIIQMENLCIIGAIMSFGALVTGSIILVDFIEEPEIPKIRWIAKINGRELP